MAIDNHSSGLSVVEEEVLTLVLDYIPKGEMCSVKFEYICYSCGKSYDEDDVRTAYEMNGSQKTSYFLCHKCLKEIQDDSI